MPKVSSSGMLVKRESTSRLHMNESEFCYRSVFRPSQTSCSTEYKISIVKPSGESRLET